MERPLAMFAYLRFMEPLHELTGLCPRPNLNQTWCSIIYFTKTDGCVKQHQMKIYRVTG